MLLLLLLALVEAVFALEIELVVVVGWAVVVGLAAELAMKLAMMSFLKLLGPLLELLGLLWLRL